MMNPQIGDTQNGRQLGKRSTSRFVYQACIGCGKLRWVRLRNGEPTSVCCYSCNGKANLRDKHPGWKGGRKTNRQGYVVVILPVGHPPAQSHNRILEHRLIMEQKLGRYLLSSEQVHHINGIRDDNRPENLELISSANHQLRGMFCSHCELRKEIRLLRWQLKELTRQLQGVLIASG